MMNNKNIYISSYYHPIGGAVKAGFLGLLFLGSLLATGFSHNVNANKVAGEEVYKEVKETTIAFPTDLKGLKDIFEYDGGLKEPLVLRGAAQHWPAMQWSPEWLSEHYGDLTIFRNGIVMSTDKEGAQFEEGKPKTTDMSLSSFIQLARNKEAHFIKGIQFAGVFGQESASALAQQVNLDNDGDSDDETDESKSTTPRTIFPLELEKDLHFPSSQGGNSFLVSGRWAWQRFLQQNKQLGKTRRQLSRLYQKEKKNLVSARAKAYATLFWVASKDNITELHQDIKVANIAAVQLYGRKQWVMIPPSYVNPEAGLLDESGFCELSENLDMTQPDAVSRESKLSGVPLYTVVLQPGDILLMPKQWLHFVKALDMSISAHAFVYSEDSVLPSWKN